MTKEHIQYPRSLLQLQRIIKPLQNRTPRILRLRRERTAQHLSYPLFLGNFFDFLNDGRESTLHADDCEFDVVGFGKGVELEGFGGGASVGLLDVDVFPGFDGGREGRIVQGGFYAADYGVDVWVGGES
jgi:hypothetical protein